MDPVTIRPLDPGLRQRAAGLVFPSLRPRLEEGVLLAACAGEALCGALWAEEKAPAASSSAKR